MAGALQEAIFGDAKNDAALDAIPTKRLIGNQLFTLCAMMAHNLSRELQMLAGPAAERALAKRPAAWPLKSSTPCGIGSSKERAVSPGLKASSPSR